MAFRNSIAKGVSLARALFQSPNFQTGVSGWALFLDGDAEFNNALIRGTIQVGTTQNIEIGVVGGVAEINFNSGLPGETTPGIIAQSTFVQPNSGATEADLIIQSAVYNNGGTFIAVKPPDTQDIAVVQMQTFGETSPPGQDGVTGALVLGTLALTTDIWQLYIANENSVIDPGPALGHPPLILGNQAQSRLYMSVSEFLSLTGGNLTETFYLNCNNTQAIAGGLINPTLRQQSTAYTGAAFTPATGGYVNSGISIVGLLCPASGTGTVWMRFLVTANTAHNVADFVAGCVQVNNTTQGTIPFAATDNRCAQVDGAFMNSAGSTNFITLYTQICATGLGNPLDALTISAQFHQNSNAVGRFFNVSKVEIGWIPSL